MIDIKSRMELNQFNMREALDRKGFGGGDTRAIKDGLEKIHDLAVRYGQWSQATGNRPKMGYYRPANKTEARVWTEGVRAGMENEKEILRGWKEHGVGIGKTIARMAHENKNIESYKEADRAIKRSGAMGDNLQALKDGIHHGYNTETQRLTREHNKSFVLSVKDQAPTQKAWGYAGLNDKLGHSDIQSRMEKNHERMREALDRKGFGAVDARDQKRRLDEVHDAAFRYGHSYMMEGRRPESGYYRPRNETEARVWTEGARAGMEHVKETLRGWKDFGAKIGRDIAWVAHENKSVKPGDEIDRELKRSGCVGKSLDALKTGIQSGYDTETRRLTKEHDTLTRKAEANARAIAAMSKNTAGVTMMGANGNVTVSHREHQRTHERWKAEQQQRQNLSRTM